MPMFLVIPSSVFQMITVPHWQGCPWILISCRCYLVCLIFPHVPVAPVPGPAGHLLIYLNHLDTQATNPHSCVTWMRFFVWSTWNCFISTALEPQHLHFFGSIYICILDSLLLMSSCCGCCARSMGSLLGYLGHRGIFSLFPLLHPGQIRHPGRT